MATKKLYDLAVRTGTYTDRDGNDKGRYENVGSILQLDDGGKMILLKRTFNPAGVPFKEGSDQIIVSMFEPREKEQQSAPPREQSAHNRAKANGYQSSGFEDMKDDKPF